MNSSRLPFIDWMKCLGMALIVFGHTGGGGEAMTAPFYPKQLGVAFFVFVTGFTLAQDRRRPRQILLNRLFEMYLFGGLFAVGVSIVSWLTIGDLVESNYLPFALGANVLLNYFPANPTTWFIGTYLHLLLIGLALSRSVRIRPWMVVAWMVCEVVFRATLNATAGPFVAYMSFANWGTVLLLGICAGQHQTEQSGEPSRSGTNGNHPQPDFHTRAPILMAVCGVVLACWPLTVGALPWDDGFPFRQLSGVSGAQWLLLSALLVTALYATCTWLWFQVTRLLPDAAPVRFLARNTLVVFIAHMPLVYGLSPVISRFVSDGPARVVVNQAVFYVLLAVLSEALRRVTRPDRLRAWLANGRMFGPPALATPTPSEA